MNEAALLAQFERISEAPETVPRLRRFILDLAVRGKLVEQAPSDEPAQDLLKRIGAARLKTSRGQLSMVGVDSAPVGCNEQPFPLPASWAWIRVGDAFLYDAGIKREPKDLDPDQWLLELEDVEKDTSVVLARHAVHERQSLSTKSEFQEGDILYGKLRPYLNKVVVASEPGYSTTEIVAIRPYLPLCSAYCCLAFRRPDFVEYVERLGRGTKMPRLRTPDAVAALFPLPPLAEQQRIAARADELMALCDRLETAQAERENRRERLVAASLQRLGEAGEGDPEEARARFYLGELPRMTARVEHVRELRKTILNLAVQGRLVPQDPNDEPALELLKRAAAAARAYSRQQRIAPFEPAPIPIGATAAPLAGWAWTRLGSLCRVITDGDHQPPPKSEEGVAFLTIGNVTTGQLDFTGCRTVSKTYFDSLPAYRRPTFGDILYTVVGATYGRPAYIDTQREFCVQRHIAILKPIPGFDVKYLTHLLASPMIYKQASRSITGTAQPTIPLRPLRNFLVLVPPLAEQQRIVAKADELMALCDRLEEEIGTAQAARRLLLEAVLHRALGGETAA